MTELNSWLPWIVSIPLMLAGLVGSVFPALPGVALIWGGMLSFYFLDDLHRLDITFLIIQGILTASTYVADYLITIWGVKKYDGSKAAAWGAALGSLLVFVIGPLGIIIGPLLGAIAGDLISGQMLKQAFRSGFGSFVGFLFAMLYRLIVCGVMLFWFVIKVIW